METTERSPQWGDESHFCMIDVGEKVPTRRKAQAQGEIHLSRTAYLALEGKTNPKGDVLALAEAAGIMAAKKTSDLLPLCHPLPIEQIRILFQLDPKSFSITVFCEVITTAKTGVEMEALAGVNGSLLCIYDLSKAVDPVIGIQNIRLNFKEGGKTGKWFHPEYKQGQEEPSELKGGQTCASSLQVLRDVRAVVLTVSDRVSTGKAIDRSGPELVSFLSSEGCQLLDSVCVRDEKREIQNAIFYAVREKGAQLVITTGGTGLSPRDVTPEALQEICDRVIPGIGEKLRLVGSAHTEMSWISRSLGALMGGSLVIALPGSLKAIQESLPTLKSLLPHALHIMEGGNHDKSKH